MAGWKRRKQPSKWGCKPSLGFLVVVTPRSQYQASHRIDVPVVLQLGRRSWGKTGRMGRVAPDAVRSCYRLPVSRPFLMCLFLSGNVSEIPRAGLGVACEKGRGGGTVVCV